LPHDLIPLDRAPIGSLTVEEVASVRDYAKNATAESTRAAYNADFALHRKFHVRPRFRHVTKPPATGTERQMPFDDTLRGSRVTIAPPTPPERGGPQRIHVMIEIVDRRQAPQRRRDYALGMVILTLAIIGLLGLLGGFSP